MAFKEFTLDPVTKGLQRIPLSWGQGTKLKQMFGQDFVRSKHRLASTNLGDATLPGVFVSGWLVGFKDKTCNSVVLWDDANQVLIIEPTYNIIEYGLYVPIVEDK